MKTILVGYNESEPSLRALDRAASLADAFEARLIVTNVAHRGDRSGRPVDPAPAPRDFAGELAPARAYLEDRGVGAEYVAAEGEPARMIAAVADELDADLVVVGTREAGLAERIAHPSVSRELAHTTHRDVLIVHPECA